MHLEQGESRHGFRLQKKQYVPEVEATAYTFLHEKSGARLFYLETTDDNKVFSIAFRTPPTDDTGVAHIVEHSTLCGSRKYPLKEPFVELVKGSLSTFLNAITFPDKTMYPVASRNDQDFKNLMDVYLDAVFYPRMLHTPQIFMQEGWHYEILDAQAPLAYSGVVYNEMKGALSSPEDVLENETMRALYPDTTYAKESGGNPDVIPTLTQEAFTAFHQRFYHPANAYIYLYGQMDIDERLAYLDKEYLANFTRLAPDSEIPLQKAFPQRQEMRAHYAIGEDESTEGKTFLALNYTVGEADDAEGMMALEILEHALLKTEAAPLRQAFIDAKIGKDVSSSLEDALLQPFLSIVINGSEADKAQAFVQTAEETLRRLAKEGIDRTLLEASINALEFKLREADFGQYPKGLVYNIKIMNSWLYGKDPALYLFYEDLLQKMRAGLQSRYFEEVIEQRLLKNPHQALVVLEPDPTLAKKREATMQRALAAKKAKLSAQEIDHLVEVCRELKVRQQAPETAEALATIPLLAREDIRPEVEHLPLETRTIADVRTLFADVQTNGITYINLFFDTKAVSQAQVPYLYFLAEIIGAVNTKQHSYAELANLMNLHTGGIDYDISAHAKANEPEAFCPRFKIRAKALTSKVGTLFALLAEILTTSDFSDKGRIKDLADQCRSALEMQVLGAPQQMMATRLLSYLSPSGAYNEAGSLQFYSFIRDLTDNFEARFSELQKNLTALLPLVCRRHALTIGLTLKGDAYASVAKEVEKFVQSLPITECSTAVYHYPLEAKNEGILTASRVQYVGKAANFIKLGYKFHGAMRVLETILRYDYFWTKIRVQGGAYGAVSQVSRAGLLLFGSYRDPHLQKTLETFDSVADFLAHFDVPDREMTKFIIGTMSTLDMPLTPQMKGNLAQENFLRGITEEMRQQTRTEVLQTKQADIRALAPMVQKAMAQNVLCALGNERLLQEHKSLFKSLFPAIS